MHRMKPSRLAGFHWYVDAKTLDKRGTPPSYISPQNMSGPAFFPDGFVHSTLGRV